jgi:hypothetical protein
LLAAVDSFAAEGHVLRRPLRGSIDLAARLRNQSWQVA